MVGIGVPANQGGKVKKITLLAAFAVVVSNVGVEAALTPLGSEYPVVGNISGHQQNPHLSIGANGGYVVWQNATDDSKGERVLATRLSPDFQGVGGAIVISQNLAQNNETNPRVAVLPDGGAFVTWQSGARSSTDIYYRVLNRSGTTSTAIQRANTFELGIQSDPDVAVLSSGEVLVVWMSLGQDGDGMGIFGQRFTTAGNPVGAEFRLSQTAARNQSKPVVIALKGDKFMVAWIAESVNGRNTSGAQNQRANVMGRMFNGSGVALGNEYRLNDGDVVSSQVELAADSEGGFVTAWVQQDESNMNNYSDVHVKTFNANGLPASKGVRQNTYLKGRQEDPGLAVIGSDALVAWTSHGQDAGGAGIQGRLVSGGTEFQVNLQGNLHQRHPAAGSNGANKYVAVWVNTIRADHSILAAQRYITSTGAVSEGVKDVTQGEITVVDAEERRRVNQSLTSKPATPAAPSQGTATLNITPRKPTVASVAPKANQASAPATSTAPQAVTGRPEPKPAAVPTATPVQSVTRAADTARQSMAQLQSRATTQSPRLNLRNNTYANAASAAQSTLLQHARSRMAGNMRQPTFQSRSSIFRQSSQPSGLSRAAFLRQPLTSMAANRGTYLRSNQRTATPSTLTSRAAPATAAANRFSGYSGYNRTSQMANYTRSSSRMQQQAGTTASERMSSMMNRAQASAALARNSGQRPVPASIIQNGRGTQLKWIAQSGSRYQVQSSNDKSNWQNVGGPRTSRMGTDAMNVRNGGPRYYRVVKTN